MRGIGACAYSGSVLTKGKEKKDKALVRRESEKVARSHASRARSAQGKR